MQQHPLQVQPATEARAVQNTVVSTGPDEQHGTHNKYSD
jgi:hypothetical protein